MKSSMEIQLVIKGLVISVIIMSNYFGAIDPFQKNSVQCALKRIFRELGSSCC